MQIKKHIMVQLSFFFSLYKTNVCLFSTVLHFSRWEHTVFSIFFKKCPFE